MAFKRLAFLKDWTRSDDFPTHEDSEAQVREDLQYHPNAIRDFLNDVLLKALESPTAMKNIGASFGGVSGTLEDVLKAAQEELDKLDQSVVDLALGEAPEAVKAAVVDFTAEEWTAGEGNARLRLPREAHKRCSCAFGFNLWQRLEDGLRGGTWAAESTSVTYDEETGEAVLEAEEAYAGRIVFFGV